MKKFSILLAVAVFFTLAGFAQDTASSSSQSQTATTKKAKSTSDAKTSTVSGCVSKDPNTEGMYTLTNGRYKKGLEIGPTDKVKDHAGHQVKLTGMWEKSGAAMGDKDTKGEKAERHFMVNDVTMISDTCTDKAKSSASSGTPK